jgi:hypothetical protein
MTRAMTTRPAKQWHPIPQSRLADASIDAVSYDPAGEPITLDQDLPVYTIREPSDPGRKELANLWRIRAAPSFLVLRGHLADSGFQSMPSRTRQTFL